MLLVYLLEFTGGVPWGLADTPNDPGARFERRSVRRIPARDTDRPSDPSGKRLDDGCVDRLFDLDLWPAGLTTAV